MDSAALAVLYSFPPKVIVYFPPSLFVSPTRELIFKPIGIFPFVTYLERSMSPAIRKFSKFCPASVIAAYHSSALRIVRAMTVPSLTRIWIARRFSTPSFLKTANAG